MSGESGPWVDHRWRAEAVRLLQHQADQGRLAPADLAERVAAARAARTRDDLGRAFVDLTVDPPAEESIEFPPYPPIVSADRVPPWRSEPAPIGPEEERERRLRRSVKTKQIGVAILILMWPAILALNFVFDWYLWWLFLVAAFGGGWIRYLFGIGERPGGSDV